MAERLKAIDSKSIKGATPSRVQIPPFPQIERSESCGKEKVANATFVRVERGKPSFNNLRKRKTTQLCFGTSQNKRDGVAKFPERRRGNIRDQIQTPRSYERGRDTRSEATMCGDQIPHSYFYSFMLK